MAAPAIKAPCATYAVEAVEPDPPIAAAPKSDGLDGMPGRSSDRGGTRAVGTAGDRGVLCLVPVEEVPP